MTEQKIDLENIRYEILNAVEIKIVEDFTVDIEIDDSHYYLLKNGQVSHNSISTLTRTTSGIEPTFLLEYTRRRKVNKDNDKIDFVDNSGDCWEEYAVVHPGFQLWKQVTGKDKIEDSPYHKSTSADLDWLSSVKLQGAVQRWNSSSISKTTNLPKGSTKELISDLYFEAWRQGCKGCTIYVDDSRDGVLIQKKNFQPHNAPKRPLELPCDIHRVSIKGENWTIIIGLLDDSPYEVFGGHAESLTIPAKFEKGIVKKTKRKTIASRYDLYLGDDDDPFIIGDIVKTFNNVHHASLTRLISLSLRHGSSVKYVTQQLKKDEHPEGFQAFSKVLARVLKRYIKDGEVANGTSCPECGGGLVFSEGCERCSCGWNKCS